MRVLLLCATNSSRFVMIVDLLWEMKSNSDCVLRVNRMGPTMDIILEMAESTIIAANILKA